MIQLPVHVDLSSPYLPADLEQRLDWYSAENLQALGNFGIAGDLTEILYQVRWMEEDYGFAQKRSSLVYISPLRPW